MTDLLTYFQNCAGYFQGTLLQFQHIEIGQKKFSVGKNMSTFYGEDIDPQTKALLEANGLKPTYAGCFEATDLTNRDPYSNMSILYGYNVTEKEGGKTYQIWLANPYFKLGNGRSESIVDGSFKFEGITYKNMSKRPNFSNLPFEAIKMRKELLAIGLSEAQTTLIEVWDCIDNHENKYTIYFFEDAKSTALLLQDTDKFLRNFGIY